MHSLLYFCSHAYIPLTTVVAVTLSYVNHMTAFCYRFERLTRRNTKKRRDKVVTFILSSHLACVSKLGFIYSHDLVFEQSTVGNLFGHSVDLVLYVLVHIHSAHKSAYTWTTGPWRQGNIWAITTLHYLINLALNKQILQQRMYVYLSNRDPTFSAAGWQCHGGKAAKWLEGGLWCRLVM